LLGSLGLPSAAQRIFTRADTASRQVVPSGTDLAEHRPPFRGAHRTALAPKVWGKVSTQSGSQWQPTVRPLRDSSTFNIKRLAMREVTVVSGSMRPDFYHRSGIGSAVGLSPSGFPVISVEFAHYGVPRVCSPRVGMVGDARPGVRTGAGAEHAVFDQSAESGMPKRIMNTRYPASAALAITDMKLVVLALCTCPRTRPRLSILSPPGGSSSEMIRLALFASGDTACSSKVSRDRKDGQ
jgi:hypothetical protein